MMVSESSACAAVVLDMATVLDGVEPLTDEQFSTMVKEVRKGERPREQFAERLALKAKEAKGDAGMAMKLAQGYYALSDYKTAIEQLGKAGSGARQCRLKGCCLRELGQYEAAIKEFEEAQTKGSDSFGVSMEVIHCYRADYQKNKNEASLEAAMERLKRASRIGEIRAEYHYQSGRLFDVMGEHDQAISAYEKAIALDGNHANALFYLAYTCDLYGSEEEAMEYYEKCIETGYAPVSALLNLAVLCEDCGYYRYASRYVKQVLDAYPNHARARMFYKDIESSKIMYYDEDQERRMDHQNRVLEIPISDFELSVRSRNCLRKMNIRYLGDLLKVTESELLAYKNFGETSLQEIKVILNSKGLRLGQLLEDKKAMKEVASLDEVQVDNEELSVPIGQLALTVRSRKCLERLNLTTIGDLVNCTEAELLGCKNFGQTSLVEVKHCLSERNLSLRQLDS
jgi:DNA-directed RNA polymerase subunit alpha